VEAESKPKLRSVEVLPIEHQGQPLLLLRDPLQLQDATIAVPRTLGPLLALMDGTRDAGALEAALGVRHGVRLAPGLLSRLLDDLDAAYLLANERFEAARLEALRTYREAAFRPMVTRDAIRLHVDEAGVAAELQRLIDGLPALPAFPAARPVRGLVSPHIDYERGGPVYAEVWRAAAEAIRQAELVILFGTDHNGSGGMLTLTRQSYATPWGVLPTEVALVDALARAVGEDVAFAEELHHRREHSLELASVWLHLIRGGSSAPVVPILCGSFGGFIAGEGEPATHEPFSKALDLLRNAMSRRRTLVVAAADLAHMGPAFGDAHGLDLIGRAQLRRADECLLSAVHAGDAQGFFEQLKAERDRRHVCGLPPIYLALRLLGEAKGEAAGYALCPADPHGMSYVSVAGVILH
jgi:AmmeMemoRadiSam system protein B